MPASMFAWAAAQYGNQTKKSDLEYNQGGALLLGPGRPAADIKYAGERVRRQHGSHAINSSGPGSGSS